MNQGLKLNIFARDVFYNLVRQGFSIVVGIGTSVLLARGLGVDGRGQYALIALLPTLVVTFTNAGVSPATAYYVALKKYDQYKALQSNVALSIWIGVVGVILGAIVAISFSGTLFRGTSSAFLLFVLLGVPTTILTLYIQAIFQGLQDFKSFNVLSIAPQLSLLIFTFVFLHLLQLGVWGAVFSNVLGSFTSTIIVFFLFRQLIPANGEKSRWKSYLLPDIAYTQDLFRYGIKSHLSNIVAFLNYRSDTLLVNLLVGTSAVGIYGVAVGIAEKLWILSGSISTVLFPRVASLESETQKRDALTPFISRQVFAFGLIISIMTGVFSNWVVVFLYGSEFQSSATALLWLLPGIVTAGTSRVLANDIAGRGKPQINLIHSIFALVINIVSNLILLPRFGASGASIASSISYTFTAIIKTIAYCKISGAKWQEIWILSVEDVKGWSMLLQDVLEKIKLVARQG